MCANCGCGIAEDKHSDERNITWTEIQSAADANGQTPEQAIENMREMASQTTQG